MPRTFESARASRVNNAAENVMIGHILEQSLDVHKLDVAERQQDVRPEVSRQVGRVAAILSSKSRPYATR